MRVRGLIGFVLLICVCGMVSCTSAVRPRATAFVGSAPALTPAPADRFAVVVPTVFPAETKVMSPATEEDPFDAGLVPVAETEDPLESISALDDISTQEVTPPSQLMDETGLDTGMFATPPGASVFFLSIDGQPVDLRPLLKDDSPRASAMPLGGMNKLTWSAGYAMERESPSAAPRSAGFTPDIPVPEPSSLIQLTLAAVLIARSRRFSCRR